MHTLPTLRHAILFVSLLMLLPLSAQDEDYIISGSAENTSCGCYQLTADAPTQVGSVWNQNLIDLSESFAFSFEVYLGDNNGADGMAFGLQPNGTNIGINGNGMGLGGVTPSVGVYFDTYQNGMDNDPFFDHMSIQANGNVIHDSGADDLAGPVDIGEVEDDTWRSLTITWDVTTTTLSAVFDGTAVVEYNGDMVADIFGGDPQVFWGFTASTGGETNVHAFCTLLDAEADQLVYNACPGQQLTLTDASNVFQADGAVSSWTLPNGDTFEGEEIVLSFDEEGTYLIDLTITDDSGCEDTQAVTVLIGGPTLEIVSAPIRPCIQSTASLVAELTPQEGVCTFDVTLTDSFGDGWNGNTIDVVVNGEIILTLELPEGDFGTASFELPSGQTFELIFNNTTFWPEEIGLIIVDGSGQEIANYTAGDFDDDTTGIIFDYTADCIMPIDDFQLSWSGGDLNGPVAGAATNFTVLSDATYTVTADDGNGCVITQEVSVDMVSLSSTTETLPVNCEAENTGQALISVAGGDAPYFFELEDVDSNGDGQFDELLIGDYVYSITDANGCVITDSLTIDELLCELVITIPNVFSPNGDELNDVFGVDIEGNGRYSMEVFNRWGSPIFDTQITTEGWNGLIDNSGADVPEGVYYYVISAVEEISSELKTFKGTVQLVR